MRICVVYDCLFPHTVGGAERWYRNLAERLIEDGHEVTYLTLRQWDRGQTPELAGGRARIVSAGPRMSLYTPDGRRRIAPPLVFGLGVLAHLLRRRARYDAVHVCSFPYFSLLAAALARPLGRYRLTVDWFEVWSDSYWREYLGRVGGRVGGLVQRLCARVDQRAFCYSRLHARRLRQEGLRGEIAVLRGLYAGPVKRSTVDRPTVAQPAVARSEHVVLFAGRMIPEKRAPLAVSAIAAARARIEGLRGVLLGDGPQREAVLAMIAAEGLGESVSAPGFTAAQTVEAEMARALCLLAPSIREGYGLVVVEAAARGTPSIVIAGPDNAAVELIEEGVNGFVCPSSDPERIADAIARAHEAGPRLRQSTADWFAQHARELSLEGSLERVLASYGAGADADEGNDRARPTPPSARA
jgi:glycosyltransferase involved in cell wall biosynthesis